jgi:hypothetical protein
MARRLVPWVLVGIAASIVFVAVGLSRNEWAEWFFKLTFGFGVAVWLLLSKQAIRRNWWALLLVPVVLTATLGTYDAGILSMFQALGLAGIGSSLMVMLLLWRRRSDRAAGIEWSSGRFLSGGASRH